MIQLPEDRRPPLTPQLALRVAIVGGVALAMFAIVFFRLWYLQVLSGDKYVAQAHTNRVRTIAIPAPRGQIVDRNGSPLVDSQATIAVVVTPADLPKDPVRRDRLFRKLAAVLGDSNHPAKCTYPAAGGRDVTVPLSNIACAVTKGQAELPYATVTLKTDVPLPVYGYLQEHQDAFPGVSVEQVWLRRYPLHTLAAQLFGTVGPIQPGELHDPRFHGASRQDIVGQSGLEYYYDRYLRGSDGAKYVQVDAAGKAAGDIGKKDPVVGHTLKVSIDENLQKAGEAALGTAISNNPPATAGAFVAMDPRSGAVLAMGSNPNFDPNVLAHPITQAKYNALFGPQAGSPLYNRAIASVYPTGSTFKAITATAALQSGVWSLGQIYDDTGTYSDGPGLVRHNAGGASYGPVDMVHAIQFSVDTFFYRMGNLMNRDVPQGGPLQKWAHAFGVGRQTGIDIGGEPNPDGILPSPAWRAGRDKLEASCENATGPFRGKPKHSTCGIADGRPWSVGDNENTAVGQGDVEATPLQLATAYAAIENGGTIIRPHVGAEVDAADGTVLQQINPAAQRHLDVAPQNLDAVRTGLHLAASASGGTSADVFSGWNQSQYPVYGKTGTAQHGNGQADQSWYVCYVPDPKRPIVVVVTVEQGGFGAAAAAPAARQILSQWFYGKRGNFVAGQSHTL